MQGTGACENIGDTRLKCNRGGETILDNTDFFGYVDAARSLHNNAQRRSLQLKPSTITYLVILAGAALWCFALVLPPLLLSAGGGWDVVGVALYQPFHRICHQLADRSFHIFGSPLAVCIRCTAIYAGFLLGTLLYLPARSAGLTLSDRRAVLIVSVIPMLVDVMLDGFGLHASTTATRLFTGSVFGMIVPFYIIPSAQEAVQELLAASRVFSPSDARKGSTDA